METTTIPTRAELVRRASEIIPILQANAQWHEQHRRLHDETIEALTQIGLFRMRRPQRYGGYESDTRTLVEVLAEIGQGDGSAAWVSWVLAGNTWLLGKFPESVQDEVFATPDVRVSGTLSPSGKVERQHCPGDFCAHRARPLGDTSAPGAAHLIAESLDLPESDGANDCRSGQRNTIRVGKGGDEELFSAASRARHCLYWLQEASRSSHYTLTGGGGGNEDR